MIIYADGLSPASVPGHSFKYPAHAIFENIREFFLESQERIYFSGYRFAPDAESLAQSTSYLNVSISIS